MSGLISAKRRIALVYHSERLDIPAYPGDLTLLFQLMQRQNVEYEIVAWDDDTTDWSRFTLILLTGELDYAQELEKFLVWLNRLEKYFPGVLRNSPQIVRWNCNKKYMIELESQGIRLPSTLWLDQQSGVEEALEEFSRAHDLKQIVIKNIVDANGISAWRCTLPLDNESVAKLKEQASTSAHGVMVQEFIPEIMTEGEWSLIYFDRMFSHAVLKRVPPNSDEFRIHEVHGGDFVEIPDEDVPPAILEFGNRVLACVCHEERLLVARVDIIRDENGPMLMELELLDPFLYFSQEKQAQMLLNVLLDC